MTMVAGALLGLAGSLPPLVREHQKVLITPTANRKANMYPHMLLVVSRNYSISGRSLHIVLSLSSPLESVDNCSNCTLDAAS